jgi:parvulin-like peptidyl-prolyl isomerase
LQTWFEKNKALYLPPTLISFRHIYFSPDKRGSNAQADARKFLADTGQPDTSAGDRFMFQSSYDEQTAEQVARIFGNKFADEIFKLEPGRWRGPVESGLGWHLVWVDSILPGEAPEFDAVSKQVKADWLAEQRSEMKRIEFEALKARYQIIIAPTKVDSAQELQLAVQQPVPME